MCNLPDFGTCGVRLIPRVQFRRARRSFIGSTWLPVGRRLAISRLSGDRATSANKRESLVLELGDTLSYPILPDEGKEAQALNVQSRSLSAERKRNAPNKE